MKLNEHHNRNHIKKLIEKITPFSEIQHSILQLLAISGQFYTHFKNNIPIEIISKLIPFMRILIIFKKQPKNTHHFLKTSTLLHASTERQLQSPCSLCVSDFHRKKHVTFAKTTQ